MSFSPHLWVLVGSTFLLSALWAAVLLVLVRVREEEAAEIPGSRSHMGVELAWAVIPALLVLSVVIPTLQGGADLADRGTETEIRVVEGTAGR